MVKQKRDSNAFCETAHLRRVLLSEKRSLNTNISKKSLEDFLSVLMRSLLARIFFSLSMTDYLTFENFQAVSLGFVVVVLGF